MNTQVNISSTPNESNAEDSALGDIDFGKIISIVLKSLIWVLIINALAFFVAFTYLRYYKPVYRSTSSLKLTVKNGGSVSSFLGISSGKDDNIKQLLGEIEFIRSDIIVEEVIRNLDIQVSFYLQGNFIDSELFENPPYSVEYELKDPNLYDQKIFIELLNKDEFLLSYIQGTEKFSRRGRRNQKVETPALSLRLDYNERSAEALVNRTTYFIINSENRLKSFLKKNLTAGITKPDARIISINFQENNRRKAQAIVQAVDSAYMEKSVEEKNKSNRQQIDFLNQQLKQYEDSLILYESQIQSFFLENKTKNIDDKLAASIKGIEELIQKKQEVARNISLLRELQALILNKSDLKEFLPLLGRLDNESIASNIRSLNNMMIEKELLGVDEKVESNNTARAREINIKLNNAYQTLIDLINANEKILYEELRRINSRLIEVESSLTGLPSKGRQFNRISRLYSQYDNYYATLLNKRTEIKIAEAGIVPEFIILSPASLPNKPIAPQKFQVYAVAGGSGIFLSIILIVIRYLLHNTITSQGELEKLTQASILGIVPEYKKAKLSHTRLIVGQNPKSSINEALRSIRTNLDYMLPTGKGLYDNSESTVISVTSTISGEGKTFMASNLGGIIALSDMKVIILDFDMRKPKLHLAFDAENNQGISSILIGKKTIQECVQPTEIENLKFISSGPTPPNPSELILREDFDLLVENLRRDYDVIIIDTPPVGLVTDGILIMKQVDMPIYVVKANYSKRVFAKNINRLIRANNFNNMSVVLNAVKQGRGGYGYGGYGYGGYGYGGYYEESEKPKSSLSRLMNVFRSKKNK